MDILLNDHDAAPRERSWECNRQVDGTQPSLWGMRQIAQVLDTDSKRGRIGFHSHPGKGGDAMVITLSMELKRQLDREVAAGRYERSDDLIEHALRDFLEKRERARRRLQENPADLYAQVLSPDVE
jgi:Arc/MetJ-type ribon-helix-helix transcriptional regulator